MRYMFKTIVRKRPQERQANYTGRTSLLERLCHVLHSTHFDACERFEARMVCSGFDRYRYRSVRRSRAEDRAGLSDEDSLTWAGSHCMWSWILVFNTIRTARRSPRTVPRERQHRAEVKPRRVCGRTDFRATWARTRVGLQGIEPWWATGPAVFQAETFFNPQSGENRKFPEVVGL